MKFFFRKKGKETKTYADKLPWVIIQNDLLEARLWTVGISRSRGSSRGSSRSSSPIPGLHEGHSTGSSSSGWCDRCGRCGWCGRLCVVRLAQLTLLLTLVTGASHILLATLTTRRPPTPTTSPSRPSVSSLTLAELPHPPPSTLLDLKDFRYTRDAVGSCSPSRLYFLFLVHSRPDHFRQRQAIRATWGGYRTLEDGWVTRTIFMLGEGSGGGGEGTGQKEDKNQPGGLDVGGLVEQEADRHGDLVVGNFHDHYHNLTYKHVMALKWAATKCPHANYVVKADDDAFIDVPGLKSLLERTFGADTPPPPRMLACNVLPAGTEPQREGKWAVSTRDYPWDEYPRYCAGLAYVATPDTVQQLYRAAHSDVSPRIWVDDVWVTGLLAESLQLQPHYLNLRYSYDHNEMVQWAQKAKGRPKAPPPYTFAHLDPACPDWRTTLQELWQHATNGHALDIGANPKEGEPASSSPSSGGNER
ncbi:beta-1,3-galactosyltransferase 1-like [Macrobrachium nipponense]|uniref:beta-1,3-galactosyltransferase 1-like n=1 Tax=Macrobrachium nipponense TaxID=159736 RepID=UPI0030C8215D